MQLRNGKSDRVKLRKVYHHFGERLKMRYLFLILNNLDQGWGGALGGVDG